MAKGKPSGSHYAILRFMEIREHFFLRAIEVLSSGERKEHPLK
jgi:hypothetical protein